MPKVGTLRPRHDVPHLHGAGEPRLRLRSRHGEEAARVAGAAAGRNRAVRQFAFHRRQAERLSVLALGDLARHRQCSAPACCPSRSSPAWASSAMSIRRSTCRCISSSAATTIIDVAGHVVPRSVGGQACALPGERATISDWANHLSTIFPEVRLKRYLEMRGADGGPWRRLRRCRPSGSACSTTTTALDAAWDLVKDWTAEERQKLRDDVPTLASRRRSAAARCSRSPTRRSSSRARVSCGAPE